MGFDREAGGVESEAAGEVIELLCGAQESGVFGEWLLAVAALSGQMSRYESLPPLLADDDDVRALIDQPDDPALRSGNDAYLKAINERLGSSDIYVMREGGETIAASNFDLETSFVGENFRYRPYYTEAIAGRTGATQCKSNPT